MKAAAPETLPQRLLRLGRGFSCADIKLLAGAIYQAEISKEKVAAQKAISHILAARVESPAPGRLIRKHRGPDLYAHYVHVRSRDRSKNRIIQLNAKFSKRLKFARHAAVHHCHGTSGIHSNTAALALKLAIHVEVISVVPLQWDRFVTQPLQIILQRVTGRLLRRRSWNAAKNKQSQSQAASN